MADPSGVRLDGLEPEVVAMVVCDQIYIDPVSARRSALGVLQTVWARELPVSIESMAMLLVLTEGRGRTPVRVRVVDVAEELPAIFDVPDVVDLSDARVMYEWAFRFVPFEFPEAGEYAVQFYARGTLLRQWRIMVRTDLEEPA